MKWQKLPYSIDQESRFINAKGQIIGTVEKEPYDEWTAICRLRDSGNWHIGYFVSEAAAKAAVETECKRLAKKRNRK